MRAVCSTSRATVSHQTRARAPLLICLDHGGALEVGLLPRFLCSLDVSSATMSLVPRVGPLGRFSVHAGRACRRVQALC